jgi:hypothetical protein
MHIFHRECMKLIIPSSNKCPLCRVDWFNSAAIGATDYDVVVSHYIRQTLYALQTTGEFRLSWTLEGAEQKDLPHVFHTVVCIIAYCLQIQSIGGNELDDARPGGAFGDPAVLRQAREEGRIMREVSLREDGHRAVGYLLRNIKQTLMQDLQSCALEGTENEASILVQMSADDWEIETGGTLMRERLRKFLKFIAVRALDCVADHLCKRTA